VVKIATFAKPETEGCLKTVQKMKSRRAIIVLLAGVLLFACKNDQVKLAQKLYGDWNIAKVTYRKIMPKGSDSTVIYPMGHIYFSRNSGVKCETCSWYLLNGTEVVPFFYYADPSNHSVFLNVGAGKTPVMPSVSFNGTAKIEEQSKNEIWLYGTASFQDKIGINAGYPTHDAIIVLTR
jgi:hypothetical protein